ncbi:hypothetical protein C6Q17_27265 [Burkholderia contaminans]|jgi:hypothetical protein|nr:hypothetical protein C6Q17_27265 [Burkholderia contaminans]
MHPAWLDSAECEAGAGAAIASPPRRAEPLRAPRNDRMSRDKSDAGFNDGGRVVAPGNRTSQARADSQHALSARLTRCAQGAYA